MCPVCGLHQSSCSFPLALEKAAIPSKMTEQLPSLDDNRVPDGALGYPAKTVLATILQD